MSSTHSLNVKVTNPNKNLNEYDDNRTDKLNDSAFMEDIGTREFHKDLNEESLTGKESDSPSRISQD